MARCDPNDPNYRRLCCMWFAGVFSVGIAGPKREAIEIKQKIAVFVHDELKLDLNDEKTLVTHACDGMAKFLGYEVHILRVKRRRGQLGRRSINGGIGFRVPSHVKKAKCAKYMRNGKPVHLPQRINDSAS